MIQLYYTYLWQSHDLKTQTLGLHILCGTIDVPWTLAPAFQLELKGGKKIIKNIHNPYSTVAQG